MELSVVTPAYNEAEGIIHFLGDLRSTLDMMKIRYEVILVDDGSTDSTLVVCKQFLWKELRVISLLTNSGHMAALEAGLSQSAGKFVVTMDADLQHPPLLIPKMYKDISEGKIDVIQSIRRRGSEKSKLHNIFATSFYKIMSHISKTQVQQNAADFRIMTSDVVRHLLRLEESPKVFRFLISELGFKTEFIEFQSPARIHGKSKYGYLQLKNLAIESVIGFSTSPLNFIFRVGIFLFLASSVYAAYLTFAYFTEGSYPGWTSIMVALLFLGSLQILAIGAIGRYVSQILQQVRKRPAFIISEADSDVSYERDIRTE